jgi:hypothetical protein
MSASKSDDALQRVNYFNGERLAATDFRAEQAYQLAVRRLLNRSLYTPGIVVGMEVEPIKSPDPADKHRVLVKRGLALDNLGREIFLPEDVKVQVMGAPSTTPGVVFGNLLVASYRETRKYPVKDDCVAGASSQPCSGAISWGAPSRIVAEATCEFVDFWPSEQSGKIVLSQLELSKSGEVVRASPSVREYSSLRRPQTVRPVNLSGEKDIDQANSKVLFFHIADGLPQSVTLYLRGRPFSTLYYTEVGGHTHALAIKTWHASHDFTHDHQISGGVTTDDGDHTHNFIVDSGEGKGGIDVNDTNGGIVGGNNPIQLGGKHHHGLIGLTLSKSLGEYDHDHDVIGTSADAGVTNKAARSGKPALSAFKDLIIKLDGSPVTEKICDQLEATLNQPGQWKVQVTAADIRMKGAALNQPNGTGAIDLMNVGVDLGIGRHTLEFLVADTDVGGCVQYELNVS